MYNLIMLPERPILVSDEKIKRDDLYYSFVSTLIMCHDYDTDKSLSENDKKIIAGTNSYPLIDFSMLSIEDCKRIGWVDTWQQAKWIFEKEEGRTPNLNNNKDLLAVCSLEIGFKAAVQSLNDKKFSLEDMIEFAQTFTSSPSHLSKDSATHLVNNFIRNRPKIFDVEVEMEESITFTPSKIDRDDFCSTVLKPKITNNSIKIIKITQS